MFLDRPVARGRGDHAVTQGAQAAEDSEVVRKEQGVQGGRTARGGKGIPPRCFSRRRTAAGSARACALRFAFLALIAALARPALAEPVEGWVSWVDDGDSFVMTQDGGREARVRIAGIDAPERGQPYSRLARTRLVELIKGRRVSVDAYKTDIYGRLVGSVRADGRDVGLAQLEVGLAWHDVRHLAEQPADKASRYAEAESAARAARRGLWSWRVPVPPWEWRARERGS